MNVIFLDFDGVIDTAHFNKEEDIEKKIKILADISHEYDCKVVIEAALKDSIDDNLKSKNDFVKTVFSLFDKHGIKCIGKTPTIPKYIDDYTEIPSWKEYEIRLYLFRHPEIEHYCVIDDDDLSPYNSCLNKVKDHLLTTINYSSNKEEEGLLEKHKDEVSKILKKENQIRKLVLKKR